MKRRLSQVRILPLPPLVVLARKCHFNVLMYGNDMYTLQYCHDNLKIINYGSTRAVFEVDDSTVVKVPFNYGGITQCKNEIYFYEKYKDLFPLCPVLPGSNENYVLQSKAINLEESFYTGDDEWHNSFDLIFWEAFESDDNFDIQKYIESIRDTTDSRLMQFIDKLNKIELKLLRTVCYDISCYNIGLLNNEVVILDYGYPEYLTKDDQYFVETEQQKQLDI